MLSHAALGAAEEAFVHDPKDFYNSYINGHMTFTEQRMNRVHEALNILQLPGEPDEELWLIGYEDVVSRHWAPFDDVPPLLAALDDLGIAYGAATNNVTDYQALKLEQSGLPFDVVIGTDITGKPKPHASMFLEGASRLNTAPEQTLMVGDDVVNDGVGARDAGLVSLLVDRSNALAQPEWVYKVGSLRDVLHIDALHFDNKII